MSDLSNLIITDVRPCEVRNVEFSDGFIPPWSPNSVIRTRDYIVVRVETNQGIFGLSMDGEYTEYTIPATANDICQFVAPYLIGKRVADMEAHTAFLHTLRSRGRFFFIEVALWDILGKAVGLPLYQLWGGKRNKVRVYASTIQHGRTPKERAQDCLSFAERGYRAVKLRISSDTIDGDLELVKNCREAVGPDMGIMVDANQAGRDPTLDQTASWDAARAAETAHRLADLGVIWLEEPLPYEVPVESRELRGDAPIAIAGGECEIGIRPFGEFLRKGIYDIIQPDPIIGGTPTDMLKIQALSEASGARLVYHHGKSGVGFMIGLHLSAAFGDAPWLEYMDDGRFYRADIFQLGFKEVVPIDSEGYVHCPDAPGLGIDWDQAWLHEQKLD